MRKPKKYTVNYMLKGEVKKRSVSCHCHSKKDFVNLFVKPIREDYKGLIASLSISSVDGMVIY